MRNIQISRYCHTEIGMRKSHGSNKCERAMHTPSAQANSLPSTTARHLKARWRLTVPSLTTLRSSKAGKDFIASNDSTAIRDKTPRKESEKAIINLKWILMRSVRRMFVDLEAHYCESEHCRVFTGRPANVYIQIWIVIWASDWIECVFCVFALCWAMLEQMRSTDVQRNMLLNDTKLEDKYRSCLASMCWFISMCNLSFSPWKSVQIQYKILEKRS